MPIVSRAPTFGMAVVLLDTACSGQRRSVLRGLGDRSGLETLRTLLYEGDPGDVRAEASIAPGELGHASELPALERASADLINGLKAA